MNQRIMCEVSSCLYNSNKLCSASEIQVNNDPVVKKEAFTSEQTECATFILR